MNTSDPKMSNAPSLTGDALTALVDGLVTPTPEQLARFQCVGSVGGDDPPLRLTPTDPVALIASLIARFDAPCLEATGCFIVNAQGHPTPINGLSAASAPALITRTSNDLAPLSLVTDGRPASMRPAIMDIMQDTDTRRRIEKCGVLIVAASVDETVAWRVLELPAAPLGELAGCPRPVQRQVAQDWAKLVRNDDSRSARRNVPPGSSRSDSSQASPRAGQTGQTGVGTRLNAALVAPAWNPITLTKLGDHEACPIAAQLLDIERRAGCDFGGIGVWRPPDETITTVARNLRAGNRTAVQRLLCKSLGNDVWMAEAEYSNLATDSSGDLITAHRQLIAIRDIGTSEECRAAEAEYFQLIEKQLVNPLREAGLASTDPIRRTLFEAVAEQRRLLSRVSADGYRELSSHGLADPRLKDYVGLHCRLTGDLLKLVDSLKEPNRGHHWNTKFGR